jgi:protocatechuate 3,4-dioxygenase beta subunit
MRHALRAGLVVGLAVAGGGLAAALGAGATPAASTTGTGSGQSCPSKNKPTDLRLVAGSPQTAKIQTAFDTNLQVELVNKNGCPLTVSVGGVSVTFTAPSSGASGTFASSGSNEVTVGTNANGLASAPTFTANSSEGDYEVRAESRYGSVVFHLSNTASGVVTSIAAGGQTAQAATVNTQYAQPLQVRVLDAHGAPVPGTSVTFSVGTGPSGAGASFVGGGAQATAQTDANGTATSPPLVANGTPGPFSATATVAGIGTVVTFGLDNHAAVYTLKATGQTAQRATINSRFAAPLRLQVLDDAGQPIEGTTVTFTLGAGPSGASAAFLGGGGGGGGGGEQGAAGGGGGSSATALTDANGQAVSPAFVANGTAGRFTATATVGGATGPLTFALANLAGILRLPTNRAQTAAVDHRYVRPLTARVLGAGGKPVDGVTVTFALSTGASGAGATFVGGGTQATDATDAAGRASSPPILANGVAGRFAATATIPGRSRPLTYPLRNRPGAPHTLGAGAASGETTRTGSRFPIRLGVTVADKQGNPVAGATVTFTAPARGPSGRFALPRRARGQVSQKKKRPGVRRLRVVRVKTDENGVALAPPLVASSTPGGYAVVATVARLRTAFALVNTP